MLIAIHIVYTSVYTSVNRFQAYFGELATRFCSMGADARKRRLAQPQRNRRLKNRYMLRTVTSPSRLPPLRTSQTANSSSSGNSYVSLNLSGVSDRIIAPHAASSARRAAKVAARALRHALDRIRYR